MRIQPSLQRTLHILIKGVCRECDDRNDLRIRPVRGADSSGCLQAVHFRHPHIHENSVVVARFMRFIFLNRDFPVFRKIGFHLPRLQHHGHDLRIDLHILRQKNAAAPQLRFLLLPARGDSFALHGGLKFIQNRCYKKRLGNKAVNPCLQGFFQHIIPAVGRQDDDCGLVADDLPDPPRRFHAVHLRHLPIQEDQVIGLPSRVAQFYLFDCFRTGRREVCGNARLFQHQLSMLAGDRVVINDQHAHLARRDHNVFLSVFVPGGIHQSDLHIEGGADTFFGLHLNVAVHHLHNVLRDRHAEAGASVPAGGGGVLLGEGIKQPGQEFPAHADSCIRNGETQGRLVFKLCQALHRQLHFPAFRCEFDGVAEDVNEYLAKFHHVADVIIIDLSPDVAKVLQAFVHALAAEHGVDGLKKF